MSKQYLDKSNNKYFVYDAATDSFIYSDGSTRQRPGNIDRSAFLTTPRSQERDVASDSSRTAALRSPPQGTYQTTNPRDQSYTYSTANTAMSPTVRSSALASQTRSPEEPAQPSISKIDTSMASLSLDSSNARSGQTQDRYPTGGGYNPQSSSQIQRPAGVYPSQGARPQPGSSIPSQYQPQPPSQRNPQTQRPFNPPQSAQSQARDVARRQQFQPTQSRQGNLQVWETYNPSNDVRTRVASKDYNSGETITDPNLFRHGVEAQSFLLGTGSEGEPEKLYSTFRVRPHSFFVVGRVFLVLWVEPAGATTVVTGLEQSDGVIPGRYQDEFIFSKVRRFVIIRESGSYCSALPIVSYGNRGVGKKGVNKAEHAIIYTGIAAPAPLPSEAPEREEAGMRRTAIRVVPDNPTDKLDPVSRIDFGKVHTVQHNIKVKPFGMVHPESANALMVQFRNAWHGEAAAAAMASQITAQAQKSNPERQGQRSASNNYASSGTYSGSQAAPPPTSARRESTYGAVSVDSRTSGAATYGSATTRSRTTAQTPSSSQGYPPSLSNASVQSAETGRRAQSAASADVEDEDKDDDDTELDIERRQRRSRPEQGGSYQQTPSTAQPPRSQSTQREYPGQAPTPAVSMSQPKSSSSQQQSRTAYNQPGQASSSSDAALSRSAPARGSSYAPQSGMLKAAESARNAYRRLVDEGRSTQQALQVLVNRYMGVNPGVSREQAESAILGRLNYPTG